MSDWKIKRQVLRAASFAMVLFGLLAVYIIYLSTWEADDLAKNPLNMRRAAARADIQRGSILAADGQILAETRQDGSRVYPFGTTMVAVTGYNGENIGSAGIEGHDAALRRLPRSHRIVLGRAHDAVHDRCHACLPSVASHQCRKRERRRGEALGGRRGVCQGMGATGVGGELGSRRATRLAAASGRAWR